MDQTTKKIVCGSNVGFGVKNNFNSLENPPAGFDVDWLEQNISKVDSLSANIIERIIKGEFPRDIRPLSYAISFMQNHQPKLLDDLLQNFETEVEGWSKDNFTLAGYNTAMERGLEYVPISYQVFKIDDSRCNSRFLTSSNPLIELTNLPYKIFPLSSLHCLFLNNNSEIIYDNNHFFECSIDEIEGINALTCENSWHYIYSSKPDFA